MRKNVRKGGKRGLCVTAPHCGTVIDLCSMCGEFAGFHCEEKLINHVL